MIQKLNPRIKEIIYVTGILLTYLFLAFLVFYVTWHDIIIGNLLAISVVIFFVSVFFLPGIIVSMMYLFEDLSKKVYIQNNKSILIQRNGKEIEITKDDIVRVYHIKVEAKPFQAFNRLRLIGFEYILIILKEREKVYITHLLIDPREIIRLFPVNTKTIQTFFPFLYMNYGSDILTKGEFHQRVQGFKETFKGYSAEQLKSVISNKKDYSQAAIEAARELISDKNRKANNLE